MPYLRRLSIALVLALVGCQSGYLVSRDSGAAPDARAARDAGPGPAFDAGTEGELDAGPRVDAYVDYDASDWLPDIDADWPDPDGGPPAPPEPPEDEPPEPDPEPEPEEPDDMPNTVRATYRVMQWNIAGGKEHDCRGDAVTGAVLRFVRERNLDLIGLNEVCRSQFDSIEAALRRHWGKSGSATFAAYGSGGRVGNAIFSRFDIHDVTRHRIGEDRYGYRSLVCGRLRTRPHLRFCSTHLSPATSLARPQLERVHTRIEGWWTNQEDTVILTGDFNLEPNDGAFNVIYSELANHPTNNPGNRGDYRELDDADAAHCRGYGERSVPRTGGGPCHVGRKIDLMFVRRNRIVDGRYGQDALNIPTDCGGICSDHRPVIGHVRVRVRLD